MVILGLKELTTRNEANSFSTIHGVYRVYSVYLILQLCTAICPQEV